MRPLASQKMEKSLLRHTEEPVLCRGERKWQCLRKICFSHKSLLVFCFSYWFCFIFYFLLFSSITKPFYYKKGLLQCYQRLSFRIKTPDCFLNSLPQNVICCAWCQPPTLPDTERKCPLTVFQECWFPYPFPAAHHLIPKALAYYEHRNFHAKCVSLIVHMA